MTRSAVSVLVMYAVAAFAFAPAVAQEAPPPHKSPRTPVHRESLADHKAASAPSREVQGQVTVIDGEKLHLGDIDLRLFGVVPPQLSASFGPQARAALDELTANQNSTCLIRDRDREDRFLATCHNASNADLALELLRRGLAVAARGSIASTELATAYIAAEQAAETQKVGLWSVVQPPPAPLPDTAKPAVTAAVTETPKEDKQASAPKAEQTLPKPVAEIPVKTAVAAVPPVAEFAEPSSSEPAFLARYQLLVTGMVMLVTALGIFLAIGFQRIREKRAEIRALAAALRGELTAARSICLARLRSALETDEKDITWPRLRSTLYQAYVGRIGWLGAELARRIASIYGQASDYAAYYDGNDTSRAATMPRRHALQALMQHIDDVLPRLAAIEDTGTLGPKLALQSPKATALVITQPQMQAQAAPVALPGNSPQSTELVTAEPAAEPPAGSGAGASSSTPNVPSSAQFWTVVRKLVRAPWGEKKTSAANDPIAEYTALIEEEMKRFSFTESEDEVGLPTGETAANWPPKAQGSV